MQILLSCPPHFQSLIQLALIVADSLGADSAEQPERTLSA
jgi:hypothetical protein